MPGGIRGRRSGKSKKSPKSAMCEGCTLGMMCVSEPGGVWVGECCSCLKVGAFFVVFRSAPDFPRSDLIYIELGFQKTLSLFCPKKITARMQVMCRECADSFFTK